MATRKERIEQQKEDMDKRGLFFPQSLPSKLKYDLEKGIDLKIEITDDRIGYFIHGKTGIGKSYQAACIASELAKMRSRKNLAKWVNVPKLLHDIKRHFNDTSVDLIEDYSKAELVILDDLGVEQGTQWVMQTLYLIINSRYEELKTTIITSNYSINELAERFEDQRLVSRIVGMCEIVSFKGKDKRVK